MSTRILIGHKNGSAGVWVAPPGGDAASNGKMVLDSDFQCLMLHHHDVRNVDGSWMPSYNLYGYSIPDVVFPALPHLPLVMVFHSNTSGEILPFPSNTGFTNVANSGASFTYRALPDRVTFPLIPGTPMPFSTLPSIRVWTLVFRNPVEI